MTAPRVSGIVLAGGRSERIGADKLLVPFHGRPLLHHAIAALAGVTDEVIVVLGQGAVPPLPGGLGVPLRVVRAAEPDPGPLAGLVTGLEEAIGATAVVVAGDMPALVPDVLRLLVARVGGGAEGAALCEADVVRPLPLALRCERAIVAAREARAEGRASLHALLDRVAVDAVAEAEWRVLDPPGDTLADVDRPDDLAALEDR